MAPQTSCASSGVADLAGADRPDRLVGDHDAAARGHLLGGHALERGVELGRGVRDVRAGLADLQPLPHAEDRDEAVPQGRLRLGGDDGVVLAVDRPPLGVPDDDVLAGQRREHRAADVAGVGAGVVRREVLGAVADVELVAGHQRLHAAQRGERRQDDDLGGVEAGLVDGEGELLHQADGLQVRHVHLPVAGDQRPSALAGGACGPCVPCPLPRSASTARPGSSRPSRYSSDAPPPVLMCP